MKRGNSQTSTPKKGKKKRKAQKEVISISIDDEAEEQEMEQFVMFDTTKTSSQSIPMSFGQLRVKACPWMSKKTADIRDPLLRLHNQLVEFYHYISSTPAERQARKLAFSDLKKLIEKAVPVCEVKQFGSSALGLQLPDGDIDVTILAEGEEIKVLSAVYEKLRNNSDYIRLDFRRGKVPIINVHSSKHDFQFDISVNKRDGLRQLLQIQRMNNAFPQFKYLFITLKCILKIRGYSETYHGYIGSYLLFGMVFEFLYQRSKGLKDFSQKYLLSQELIAFLDLYTGTDWSQLQVLIGRGIIRDREESAISGRPSHLRFMSPDNPQDDIGGRAFKVKQIFHCFRNRLLILRHKNFRRGESVLKQLLNPSMQEFSYPNRHCS